METGKILLFLGLVLVCVFHLSNGQCEKLSKEELASCMTEGLCYDCSKRCECGQDYAMSTTGICIPKSMCARRSSRDTRQRCIPRYCRRDCRQQKKNGRCVDKRCKCE